MAAKRKRSTSTASKKRYYARKRLRKYLYGLNSMDPSSADRVWRRSTFGPNKYQRAAGQGTANKHQMAMRNALNYYGEGDYWEDAEKGALAGAGIGGMVGAGFGSAAAGAGSVPGAVVGSAIGAGLGGAIGLGTGLYDQYFGKGDYGKTVNQIVSGGRNPITVNQGADRTGDILISQTEYLGNVTASADFKIEQYELNPGIHKTFPFLSQLANNYELYEWDGLMVCYKPLSGEGGSDNVLGKVIMCTNYDPSALPFKNSLEMQNYDYCSTGKPSQTIIHGVETAGRSKVTNMLYVRNSSTSRDKVFTDIGKLFIATEGMPTSATGAIGELHITYRIRLSRAKLYATLGNFGIQGSWHGEFKAGVDAAVTSASEDFPFEITTVATNKSSIMLKLKDKDLAAATFKINVYARHVDTGLGSLYPEALIPGEYTGDSISTKRLRAHQVRNADESAILSWKPFTHWSNGLDVYNPDVNICVANPENKNMMSSTSFVLSINNPNDEQPIFIMRKVHFDWSTTEVLDDFSTPAESANRSIDDLLITVEQIDQLGDKEVLYL